MKMHDLKVPENDGQGCERAEKLTDWKMTDY